MKDKTQYWNVRGRFNSVEEFWNFELRSNIALGMIERWGLWAKIDTPEDSAGRAKLALLSPYELVDRAFKIADLFVARAEERGEVRLSSPSEAKLDESA